MATFERPATSQSSPTPTVVIAFDGSDAARHAIAGAAKVIGSCHTVVVTVWEEGLAYAGPVMPAEGMMTTPMIDPSVALEVDRSVHARADRVAHEGTGLAQSLGLDAEPLAVPDDGTIAGTIMTVARQQEAVAIVVGSRGLSGIRARLEGSTSKALLKHSPCPVLVVHEPEERRD